MTALDIAPVRTPESGLAQNMRGVKVVLQRELIRFGQDRTRMISALVQPILFLFVLGNGLSSLTSNSTGGVDLKTFMFPGVLATSTLFTAMFSAVSIVWDREFGFLREMLVAPVSRTAIILGKTLGGAVVATLQGCLVLLLAPLVGVTFSFPLIISLIAQMMLLSVLLTALGLVLAARIQQMQAIMGIMQMLLLPMSFLSGALYPINNLPGWLAFLVRINPITYAVHVVRGTVFSHLKVDPKALQALNPPLKWGSYVVPTWLQLAIVAGMAVVFFVAAVAQFQKAE